MKVRIITDSAADLPAPFRPEVTVLPMAITFERSSTWTAWI